MSNGVPEGFELFPEGQGFTNHVGPLYWMIEGDVGIMGFEVGEIHLNPADICHGGMLMTLMDMAVGFNVQLAANSESFTPTIQMTYDFLKPAYLGQWLVSDIDFRHNTPRMGFASGLLIGPDGPVMRCNGIAKLPRQGDPRFAMTDGSAAFRKPGSPAVGS